jgi:drug/metabolite transporter (DMT)-like permease
MSERVRWKTLLAFGVIYFVWGSTFLAIRVGVREVPPLLYAAMRFLVAGVVLFGWTVARGEKRPTVRQWMSASVIALLVFGCDYGALFWAEKRVPSGVAAVVLATIPVFMALADILVLRTTKLTARLGFALLVGICGVGVLVSSSLNVGGAAVDLRGAAALLFAGATWAIASVLARKLDLPESKTVTSGAEMLVGGVWLTLGAGILGEFRGFQLGAVSWGAWVALAYLIVAGSIIAYTAYVWLLHHESPTKVGTYAYVNPVVAVLLGYFFGGEGLGMRTILGTACVLASVILITTAGTTKKAVAAAVVEDAA